MTDRTPQYPPNTPSHAHPMRDILTLEGVFPSQVSLLERMFDRIERGATS